MKKLMIAAFVMVLGIAANAASVTWGMSSPQSSPNATATSGWALYVLDASTYETFAALDGDKVAAYVVANAVASGATTASRFGVDAAVKGGNYSGGDIVNSYMVIFDATTAATAKYYAYTEAASTTINAAGADGNINFGSFADATASTGGWQSTDVPEPTSGLLLLLGVAGLALKRKRA
ncbi:MAG: PEP-CTERM sorting domain-containing protein [Kiritimatiellae bacterium]|nr:PEP-CTERM sorting domain-containing protein [Kiritimatiellia bacterium]